MCSICPCCLRGRNYLILLLAFWACHLHWGSLLYRWGRKNEEEIEEGGDYVLHGLSLSKISHIHKNQMCISKKKKAGEFLETLFGLDSISLNGDERPPDVLSKGSNS